MYGSISRTKLRAGIFERRRFDRYCFCDNEVSVFIHSYKSFGWIMDMSRGGLSIEYIHTEKLNAEKEIIDIINYSGDRFFLSGIACKKVYEFEVKEKGSYHSPVTFTRCGLKCGFTERQAIRLEELVHSVENMAIS
jgi:NOL1/NOP2/fmu family ribosome biogenesis protein